MEVLIPAEAIAARLDELAAEITNCYRETPVTVVGILNGSLMFVADLIRRIRLPLRVGFITASSYRGNSTQPGKLIIRDEALPDVYDRHVLLLDDILDTGKTLTRVVAHLLDRGARSVKVGVLLRKIGRQEVPFEPDFVAFTIPNRFVVGYGLDHDNDYRHLPYIAALEVEKPRDGLPLDRSNSPSCTRQSA
ncbi:MAG: hypoxanthine phosphoribosyltransferase [Gemmataceae bacterium]|nr:hypoxanthine phosphoribosyltransferase [Gemmataceae bacterium]MDW8242852.1 hypoxanthine phosphoribosyltransferase [Thermogemmata sp.]